MRGITEDRLKEYLKQHKNYDHTQGGLGMVDESHTKFIEHLINSECKELNPWQPISTAPDDRQILLFYKGIKTVGKWGAKYRYWVDETGFMVEPTHWQELPEDPK